MDDAVNLAESVFRVFINGFHLFQVCRICLEHQYLGTKSFQFHDFTYLAAEFTGGVMG